MLRRRVFLVEEVPKIIPKNGMFHVDFGISGIPKIAINPNILLAAIELATQAYLDFNAGDVVPLDKRRAGH